MKMYGEWSYSSTNINILGTKCRLAVNLATQLFSVWRKSPVTFNRKLEDIQGWQSDSQWWKGLEFSE